jgi:chemotaxis protein MotB
MRAYRRPREAEEEESAYVSMTDLTVGFLFIVMLMMAYFATQFGGADSVSRERHDQALAERDAARAERDRLERQLAEAEADRARLRDALTRAEAQLPELERLLAERDAARAERDRLERQLAEAEADRARLRDALTRAEARLAELERLLSRLESRSPVEAYLAAAYEERRRLLERLRGDLARLYPDVLVEVSPEGDALRFQGEGLFATGSATLRPQARRVVEDLALLLDGAIACMTLGDSALPRPEDCSAGAIIEAVQIEGHTDTVGSAATNLALSTARANAAFLAMVAAAPALGQRRNLRGQPVPAVAGYGEMRLAVPTPDAVDAPANRRIDIRILMQTPTNVAEIETIRRRLREGR